MEQEEMVMGDMYIRPGEAWEYCPREALRRLSSILKNEFDLVYLLFKLVLQCISHFHMMDLLLFDEK